MTSASDLQTVLETGIVAVLRGESGELLADVAQALLAGGVKCIEVTFTVPGALRVIEQLADHMGDQLLLGAGTVLDAETARAALLAGARFIVSPVMQPEVIRLCRRYDRLVMPGALTPTEILSAWELGADMVKVFPSDVTGPRYLKALHGPLPQVRLMPTGGVNLETAEEFLKCGACALGVGGSLVEKSAVEARDFERISSLAKQYCDIYTSFRKGS